MRIQIASPSELLSEFESAIEKVPIALAKAKGALSGLELQDCATDVPPEFAIKWILRAHIGTLEKLTVLLPHDRTPTTLELLSATRNLFENLIWLKLFEENKEWGLRFYAQFLEENRKDLEELTAKIGDEIVLFKNADRDDSKITDSMIASVANASDDIEQIASIQSNHQQLHDELDQRVRRSFSLYAAAAKFNGYSYQIHLLESKELPRHLERLGELEERVEAFKTLVDDDELFLRYSKRTNWRDMAKTVGMLDQYDYLYRLSSRLLHSGPMNILTEKQLSESEQMVLLKYMVVAAKDVIELIDGFHFPGRLEMAYFEVN